jgi:hypothetical protein
MPLLSCNILVSHIVLLLFINILRSFIQKPRRAPLGFCISFSFSRAQNLFFGVIPTAYSSLEDIYNILTPPKVSSYVAFKMVVKEYVTYNQVRSGNQKTLLQGISYSQPCDRSISSAKKQLPAFLSSSNLSS